MYSEFEGNDVVDLPDDIECDFSEKSDSMSEVDDMLNNMSLEELYALRDYLTEGDVSDDEGEFPDVSDMMPLEDMKASDYSFHWDGGPTHNTDWEKDLESTEYTKKLRR